MGNFQVEVKVSVLCAQTLPILFHLYGLVYHIPFSLVFFLSFEFFKLHVELEKPLENSLEKC